MSRRQKIFIVVLACWLVLTTSLVTMANWGHPRVRAMLCMGWGLIVVWVFAGGSLMHGYRDAISRAVARVPFDWRLKFVLFATLLALIEEAVTTGMTNLAPLFGVARGQAYITASANYLDVVTLHSVVMFVPMFVGWAVLLWRYDFSAFAVFVLFGITGTMAEMSFGPQHAFEFGLWIFVYGLMVYLPAYCVPRERGARQPRWWLYPLATIIPFLFLPLVPLPLLAAWIAPNHPKIHFPPITP